MSWNYLFPTVWDLKAAIAPKDSTVTKFDLESTPHLGVYCAQESHKAKPWLIGMFEPNWAYLEATGKAAWTFSESYIAGDGTKLDLPNSSAPVLLVDNELRNHRDAMTGSDRDAMQRGRSRWTLKCGACRLSRAVRSDTAQKPVGGLYAAGMREVPLSMLAAAMEPRRGA